MYLFHLGNNRLLAVPPAQSQAAGEQQQLKSDSSLATHLPLITEALPRALQRQTESVGGGKRSSIPHQDKQRGGFVEGERTVAILWRGMSKAQGAECTVGKRLQRQK